MIKYLLGINLLAFIICYIDKRKAIKKKHRISEATLLFISFIGGAFGFTLSMFIFHHKTRKNKFIILEPIFIIMWIYIISKTL